MNKIKMLVFDVDGTLYDLVNHEIPASAIEAIRKAKENGYLFVIATGRAHYGLGKALNELKPDYILSVSGGVVCDKNHTVISHRDFMFEDVEQLVSFSRKHDAGLVFKFMDHMYIYQYPEKIDWLEGQKNSDIGSEPFIDCPSQDRHLKDMPQAACIHADKDLIRNTFNNHPRIQFLQYSNDGFDVVLKETNKGNGLQSLMDYLNLTKEEVACFGDNFNDLEMMETAGYRVAMGNAIDEVKQVADYISESTNNNGIYQALKHLNCF